MITCLSFVGILPEYIIACVHQIRCYYNGEIYLITNDLNSVHLQKIEKYNVIIVDYKTVVSDTFLKTATDHISKFEYVPQLLGREELFLRAFERFFFTAKSIETIEQK